MKKVYLIATALAALVSCTNNDFVGDTPKPTQNGDGAIVFGSGLNAITRDSYTGLAAAEKLNYDFVVGGFKGATSVATTTVFDNYNVHYTQNTANTTESNTNNWEYVGLTPNANASIPHTTTDKQTIKYWDYSQAQYDFIAYSLGNGGATATTITPSSATSSTDGAYTITGTTAQLGTVHIADLVTVLKADYGKVVNITFRSMISKVRFGLYETIPGYSVKDVKFYQTADATSSGSTPALFANSKVLPTEGTYTVYFKTVNDETPTSDKNKAHVVFDAATDGTQSSQTFGTALDYTTAENKEEWAWDATNQVWSLPETASNIFLGRASNKSTFAGTSDYYIDVLPLETGTSLTLKVDYTLVAIDGTGETIKVTGATAVVPQIYAQWKSGYAYTYLFKISDNTNGTTGTVGTDPTGLYPITFDAIVVNSEEDATQETITTVATPSITTYQKGSAVVDNNEYLASDGDIYIQVMDNSTNTATLKNDLHTNGRLWKLETNTDDIPVTEAAFVDAINLWESMNGNTTTGRNGLVVTNVTSTLDTSVETVPGADGNDISVTAHTTAKFTPSAGTYAFLYIVSDAADTYYYVPIKGTSEPDGWPENFYEDEDGNTAATTFTANTTYYKKYTNNNTVYGVKVIKVQ